MSSSNLSGPQQRLLDGARQFDEDKIVFRVEVVFAAFIDNSDIAIHCSVLVRQDTIDFVKLQGGWIILIINANSKFQGRLLLTNGVASACAAHHKGSRAASTATWILCFVS